MNSNEVRRLFTPPGCRCLSKRDRLMAEFVGTRVLPCPIHDAAGVADLDAERAAAERDRLRAEADAFRAAAGLDVEHEEPDALLAALDRKVNRSHLPLNASADDLIRHLGYGHAVESFDDDGPDAA